jgi:hypothetical protein
MDEGDGDEEQGDASESSGKAAEIPAGHDRGHIVTDPLESHEAGIDNPQLIRPSFPFEDEVKDGDRDREEDPVDRQETGQPDPPQDPESPQVSSKIWATWARRIKR